MAHPENPDFKKFYPTAVLVTAPEIIFFWVARMIMAGYHWAGKAPFQSVYFTGIVRDQKGKKMSKSLGNSPDPIALMKRYSVDGTRMGILLAAPAGNDILFDEKLCHQGKLFAHKILNAFHLFKGFQGVDRPETLLEKNAAHWYQHHFSDVLKKIKSDFENFRLSQALMEIYRLFWDAFCSHYLEMIKPRGEKKEIAQSIYEKTAQFFRDFLKKSRKWVLALGFGKRLRGSGAQKSTGVCGADPLQEKGPG